MKVWPKEGRALFLIDFTEAGVVSSIVALMRREISATEHKSISHEKNSRSVANYRFWSVI